MIKPQFFLFQCIGLPIFKFLLHSLNLLPTTITFKHIAILHCILIITLLQYFDLTILIGAFQIWQIRIIQIMGHNPNFRPFFIFVLILDRLLLHPVLPLYHQLLHFLFDIFTNQFHFQLFNFSIACTLYLVQNMLLLLVHPDLQERQIVSVQDLQKQLIEIYVSISVSFDIDFLDHDRCL